MSSITYALMALPVLGAIGLVLFLLKANETQELDELRNQRITTFVGSPESLLEGSASPMPHATPAEIFRAMLQRFAGQRLDRSDRGRKLHQELARADLKLRPEEWIGIVISVSVAMGALAYLRFQSALAVPVGMFLGYFASGKFLAFKKSRRLKKFENGLGEMIVTLSNALKAGYTFSAAIRVVADTAPYPLNVEFGRVVNAVALGAQMDDALDSLVQRNNSEDLELLVAAVKINRSAGGNLSEILDTLESTIRGRVRVKGEIRTLTAQARASGYIIAILPIALGGILTLISPAYFTPMFSKTAGLIMLGIGVFSILLGAAIIRKIVQIKV